MLATVNTALQSSIRAMDATADGLEEQGEAQQSAMVALNTSMQRRLEAAVNATRSLGSDTIYTHWGSKVCTAPSGFEVLKHYDGFTWGAHHGMRPHQPDTQSPWADGGRFVVVVGYSRCRRIGCWYRCMFEHQLHHPGPAETRRGPCFERSWRN